MQENKFNELTQRAAAAEKLDALRHMEATSRVSRVIEEMKAEGKAIELSEEEERMLRSFRRFKLRMRKDGEVFKWQTRRPEGIQSAPETAFILDPQEVG